MTEVMQFTNEQCISWGTVGEVTVIRLLPMADGRVEIYEILNGEILGVLQGVPNSRIVINLAAVQDLSSQMLGILAALYRRVSTPGGVVAVCGLGPEAARIMKLTRMETLLKIFPDEAAALRALAGDGKR
jgi:anti-anti-sigma factor